jgi:hypothetical protein
LNQPDSDTADTPAADNFNQSRRDRLSNIMMKLRSPFAEPRP